MEKIYCFPLFSKDIRFKDFIKRNLPQPLPTKHLVKMIMKHHSPLGLYGLTGRTGFRLGLAKQKKNITK